MMPVCLELIVDQRKIPDIFVECANSTMPIDIKLVRYNPVNARTGLLGGSMGGGMGGMDMGGSSMGSPSGLPGGGMGGSSMSRPGGGAGGSGRGGSMSGPGGMGSDGGMGAAAEQLSGFEVGGKIGVYGSDAVMIQVVGVIYLYNEPDPSLYEEPEEDTDTGTQESSINGDVNPDDSNQSGGVDTTSSLTPVVPPNNTAVNE